MKRLLLDTNIYGEMVIDTEVDRLKEGILRKKSSFIVFGSTVIRQELRATPRQIKSGGKNLRIDLLSLYDSITHERTLSVSTEAEELANSYYDAYHVFGGAKGKQEMRNDFLIVATASLKEMDIVVSNDEASMKSVHSFQAYTLVNSIKKLRNPQFMTYETFKKLLR